MVSGGTRTEVGGGGGGSTQILSAGVRKTIQSIKEIVGNHSDADIYVTLKETNMDPNETTQKLLNQDPFHEVKRKRDKKKEALSTGYKSSTAAEPRKHSEHVDQVVKSNAYPDRTVRKAGFSRNNSTGVSQEFRVVRDNRVGQNANREVKPVQISGSVSETNVAVKSSTVISSDKQPTAGDDLSQPLNRPVDSHPRQSRAGNLGGSGRKDMSVEGHQSFSNSTSEVQSVKPSDPQSHSTASSSNSVVGVYSSSSDPVHVPSLDSRQAANVGAIRREVGVVGPRRQTSQNSVKPSSLQNSSFSNSQAGREGPTSRDSARSLNTVSKSEQPNQSVIAAIPNVSVSRSFSSNQYTNRAHQLVGHQKASQPNKEWKPKLSQKASGNGAGVIGSPAKAVCSDNSEDAIAEGEQLQDKISHVNISGSQNVIIAAHIRVSETDRCRLTFGSLGAEYDASSRLRFQNAQDSRAEPAGSFSVPAPESSSDAPARGKQLDLVDDRSRNSGPDSPVSGPLSEHQLPKDTPKPQNVDNYPDIGLGQDNNSSYTASESQQQQDASELQSFTAYDPQSGYDIPYFRPTVDETVHGQGVPLPQEVLNSHSMSTIPASSIAMVQHQHQHQHQQQQQQQMAQMYPGVHMSHYANLMPYRQFLSPVYVPPMAMPGYSSNPAYPHPSNGSSYLLMPGGGSHLTAGGLKYGVQQFKPVPTGSPTGFGNFTSPTGYALNSPGAIGNATGLDDSSRLKYKDGNLYVPNPQAETSEIWMNPRDLSSLQSASYYNMPGQTPHAAYMPSHSGHASFNTAAAVAQSSHMQFPGLYHPPQPAALANPHHMGPTMSGNVGVGVAAATPGAQVGAYQQPQLGHMNWAGNF